MKVCSKKSVTKKDATKRRGRSGCGGGRCMKPGPIVRNPYLNFLRIFRKENCGLSPVETIRKGARAWKGLTASQRLGYIKEAFYAPRRRRNMQCHLVCKKKPVCGKGQRKRIKRKRGHGKRRSLKPKARLPKRRRRRSKARHTPSKPKDTPATPHSSPAKVRSSRPSKVRRRSSKPRSKKAGFVC